MKRSHPQRPPPGKRHLYTYRGMSMTLQEACDLAGTGVRHNAAWYRLHRKTPSPMSVEEAVETPVRPHYRYKR